MTGRLRGAAAGRAGPPRADGGGGARPGLLDRLLPPPCVLCGRGLAPGAAPVCGLCWGRLPRIPRPHCPRCGATRVLDLAGPGRCAECAAWPEGLAAAGSPYLMVGGASDLVHALKYGGWFALAGAMGRAMAPHARRLAGGTPHALEPVPLPPARLRERGFNQAALLARSIGRELGWPVGSSLGRAGSRRRQVRLGRDDRRENVRRAFLLVEDARRSPDLPVLLVDDVLTTGATAAACTSVLEAAGRRVTGAVVFARALQAVGDG